MLNYSELYPETNRKRTAFQLDGMWRFQFDSSSEGKENGWAEHLPSPVSMPVPSSFADLFTDHLSRDYCGDFWYEYDFFVPEFTAD